MDSETKMIIKEEEEATTTATQTKQEIIDADETYDHVARHFDYDVESQSFMDVLNLEIFPFIDELRTEFIAIPENDSDSVINNEPATVQSRCNNLNSESVATVGLKRHGVTCPVCHKDLAYKGNLRIHLQQCGNNRSGTKKRLHSCQICLQSFTQPQGLKLHTLTFHQVERKVFECKKCGKILATAKNLESHDLSRHNDGGLNLLFNCTRCPKKYANKLSLKTHFERVHSGIKKDSFDCSKCEKKFKHSNTLKLHFKTVHEGEARFTCATCGRNFSRIDYLESHLMTHDQNDEENNDKPRHACPICGSKYSYKSSLSRHMTTVHPPNGGLPPIFKCVHCCKVFPTRDRLKSHRRVHAVGRGSYKQYECLECEKTFMHRETYFEHVKSHQGLFDCNFCGKRLSSKLNLKQHVASVHGQGEPRRFLCDHCGIRYVDKRCLIKHVQNKHCSCTGNGGKICQFCLSL